MQTQIDLELRQLSGRISRTDDLLGLLRIASNFAELGQKDRVERLLVEICDHQIISEFEHRDRVWISRMLAQLWFSLGDQSKAMAEISCIETRIASASEERLKDEALWQLFLLWHQQADVSEMTRVLSRFNGSFYRLKCQERLIKLLCAQGNFVAAQKHIAQIKEQGDRIFPLKWMCNAMLKHGKAENAVWVVNDLLSSAAMRAVVLSSSLLHWQQVQDGELADV
ncbi:hypothetical protein TH19_08460 [Thalassospira profundimaris]|uniref:Uncharacterized protein n=1 Tax=Thalassospira profundimaris TaxID=502049 RepID=A0A367WBQ2_9PROT|nr:hypothetical protein TH19_08460 [Thalassospira profundimaris]